MQAVQTDNDCRPQGDKGAPKYPNDGCYNPDHCTCHFDKSLFYMQPRKQRIGSQQKKNYILRRQNVILKNIVKTFFLCRRKIIAHNAKTKNVLNNYVFLYFRFFNIIIFVLLAFRIFNEVNTLRPWCFLQETTKEFRRRRMKDFSWRTPPWTKSRYAAHIIIFLQQKFFFVCKWYFFV